MSKYTAEQIMAEAANWVASGNLKLASILHEYAAHLATLQSIHPPAGVVSDEWVVVGYMWQRNYSNGGHSSKLFSSKW
ncbi:MAG: hypothetical protein KGI54_18190, partial [Pseudomonadota bacterium]|nr:hypothetical protein [Pseudomonadota bacterium]